MHETAAERERTAVWMQFLNFSGCRAYGGEYPVTFFRVFPFFVKPGREEGAPGRKKGRLGVFVPLHRAARMV